MRGCNGVSFFLVFQHQSRRWLVDTSDRTLSRLRGSIDIILSFCLNAVCFFGLNQVSSFRRKSKPTPSKQSLFLLRTVDVRKLFADFSCGLHFKTAAKKTTYDCPMKTTAVMDKLARATCKGISYYGCDMVQLGSSCPLFSLIKVFSEKKVSPMRSAALSQHKSGREEHKARVFLLVHQNTNRVVHRGEDLHDQSPPAMCPPHPTEKHSK